MPAGRPAQQICLEVAGSDSGGWFGPFITLLDAKLIISDHKTAS
jgi:hypothetical protein